MKRHRMCILALCLVAFLVGCREDNNTSTNSDEIFIIPEAIHDNIDTDNSILPIDGYVSKDYLDQNTFLSCTTPYIYDGWIFYINYNKNELRKCSLDLSQDILVFSDAFGFFYGFSINADGLSLRPDRLGIGTKVFYIYDIENGVREKTGFVTEDSKSVLYKDIIIISQYTDGNTIKTYDLNGDLVKTVFSNTVDVGDYAVVDDAIYFHPFYSDENEDDYGNEIMRYDINNETTEKVFDFTVKIAQNEEDVYYQPRLQFDDRTVIVQNDFMSFVYTEIDNIEPLEIEFNVPRQNLFDMARYISSDSEYLYFSYYHSDARDTEEDRFGEMEFFMVTRGDTNPISIKKEADRGVFFLYVNDGYLYFFEGDERVVRERL